MANDGAGEVITVTINREPVPIRVSVPGKVEMICPFKGCRFVAHGRSDLSVVRSVCAHYQRSHLPVVKE